MSGAYNRKGLVFWATMAVGGGFLFGSAGYEVFYYKYMMRQRTEEIKEVSQRYQSVVSVTCVSQRCQSEVSVLPYVLNDGSRQSSERRIVLPCGT